MTEEERRAEEERARRALQEQEQSALGGLGGFIESILEMIRGFFGFLQNAISGHDFGDGDGREIEQPGGRESLFNGIRASGAAATAWARYQREHSGEAVNHRSPVAGRATVGSDHGHREHPIRGGRRMHHGVDITGASGIVASEKGVVLYSGILNGYGNTVIIGHADGTYSLYAHMTGSNMPAAGSEVRQGQAIGVMGETGGATGVHLHYEQRRGSQSIVPQINGREITRGASLNDVPSLAALGVRSGDSPAPTRFARVDSTAIGRG